MDRLRVWLAVSPLIAGGVLLSHELAYRLTSTPQGSLHAYLEHAPQVVGLLVLVGLAVAGLGARLRMPRAWPFPVAALATFAAQEHLERLGHAGELPALAASPAFLVGLALQAAVALLVWALARHLLGSLEELRPSTARLAHFLLAVGRPATVDVRPIAVRPLPGRGPPSLRRR